MTETARIDAEALDKLFAPYDRTDAPGFAVGVALKGRPGYRRGFGMASVELPVTLSPSIRMRIGSTTKHFCVLALMLLREAGQLSLDDSPREYLPELPAWAEAITLRQLMSHTSGMRDSLDLFLLMAGPGRPAPADTHLTMLAGLDSVNFAPGRNWSYNNGGYALLTEIVRRLSGQDFADFLRERILEPVGMYDSLLRPLDTELLPNSATLHVPLPGGGYARGVFGIPVLGEGGMVSTVDDMLLWLKHMAAPTVGSAETWAEMRTPVATHGYGLGLMIEKHRGLDTVHHAGGVIGGSSQMLKVLDHDLDIILMTNGRNGLELYGLVDAIIDACIPSLPPAAQDAGGEALSGTFHSPATGRVLTLAEHEGRQAMTVGGMTLPARRDAEGAITVSIIPSDLRVKPVRKDGKVGALDVLEYGVDDLLFRIEPPVESATAPLAGRYESPAAGLTATIADGGAAGAQLTLAGRYGAQDYALTPIGPQLWQAASAAMPGLGGTLEFDAAGFRFTSGRTQRLQFARAQ